MKALIAVLVVALAAGIVVQSMRVSKLKAQNEALRQQVAELKAQADHLSNQASPPAAPVTTDEDRSELLRLRNQAAQLKQVTNELQRLRTQVQQLQAANQQVRAAPAAAPGPDTNAAATGPVPRESWAFAGYATPEATLQSAIFAMSQGDYQTFLASMSPEEAARMQKSFEGKTPEQIAEEGRRETAKASSFQILAKQELAPDRVVLNVFVAGEDRAQRIMMQKIGEEWKWAGNAGRRQQQPQQAPPAPQ
jgi:FtsZ-binding cell division protein ZapB